MGKMSAMAMAQQPLRPVTTLGELRGTGHLMVVRCGVCEHEKAVDVRLVPWKRLPDTLQITSVAEHVRLKCSCCGCDGAGGKITTTPKKEGEKA
jgi:hypothetical protein